MKRVLMIAALCLAFCAAAAHARTDTIGRVAIYNETDTPVSCTVTAVYLYQDYKCKKSVVLQGHKHEDFVMTIDEDTGGKLRHVYWTIVLKNGSTGRLIGEGTYELQGLEFVMTRGIYGTTFKNYERNKVMSLTITE